MLQSDPALQAFEFIFVAELEVKHKS